MNVPALLFGETDQRQTVKTDERITTRFTVPGIKCAGCIGTIERELPKRDGIASARVNFSAKRVAIEHDPSLDEGDLAAALKSVLSL